MFIQQVIHISLSIPLYYSIRYFPFINTCEELDRAFVLLSKNILKKIPPTSIDIHCKSLVKKYFKIYNIFLVALSNLYQIITLKHVKFINVLKSFLGFVLMFIKILEIILRNYYYYLNLFMNWKLI
jgi:hypothetical protein